jgi:hypothetical protein
VSFSQSSLLRHYQFLTLAADRLLLGSRGVDACEATKFVVPVKDRCEPARNKNWRMSFSWQLASILLLVASLPACAQSNATIFGTVTDQSGAAVSGSTITATNVETQQVRRTTSGADGNYVLPELAPGNYLLTVEASGFQKYVQKGISLKVSESRQSSIQLPIGTMSQEVDVSADSVQVDTRSATISEVVDADRVKDLPLNGRNVLQLQSLVAGAGATSTGGGGQAQNNVTAINGARGAENNYTLDSADNEDPFFFTPSVFPNPDALAEFSLQTSNYGAQTGLGAGAQMNAITKSGTNKFHGTLFEYVRNQIFDAAGYFAKAAPPFHQNQFGGTVGGPIFKDRTFFFFAYQGTRQRSSPSAATLVVPDAAERSGNFSEVSKQLVDPVTGKPVKGNIFLPSSLNPASTAFLNTFVPLPNSPNNVYTYNPDSLMNDDQYIGRFDTRLFHNNQLSGRILEDKNVVNQVPSTNDLPGFLANINYVDWNLAINDTHTFSETLLNQLTFGFNDIQRVQAPVIPVQKTWGDFGSGVVRAASGAIGYDTEVQGYFTAESRWPLNQYRHSFQYSDTATWIRNAHTIYFGGDLRKSYTHQYQTFLSDGQFIFSAAYTGNQLADFETGHEFTFTQDSENGGEPVSLIPDLFVQDDWKLSRRLTINAGLRWNPWVPYHDLLNGVSQFIPGEQSTVYPTAPAGYVFPGDVGVSQNTIANRWHDFAPRVGLAYDVFGDGKTSLRAGYGVYYAFVREQALNNLSSNQPFGIALNATQPTGGINNPYSNTGNPFPFIAPQTADERAAYKFTLPLTLTVWQPNFRDGRVQQWNVNLQQQIGNWVFTTAYVGSVGEHLFIQREANPAVYGAPGTTTQARRIFAPNFGSITTQFSGGHSSYNALQFSANRGFRHGFTLLANYTWSKSMDNGSADTSSVFDPFDISRNRGLSDFDIPQSFVTSLIWRLPEFKTPAFVVKTLVNGWELNGIVTLQSGIPFTVLSGVDNSQSGVGADQANLVGNPHLAGYTSKAAEVSEFFNTKAYVVNPVGTFGDSGRNTLLGPGFEDVDLGVVKTLYTTDRAKFLFRGEAFNLLNHTNLGQPGANLSSATFGQITGLNTNTTPRVLQLALRMEF